MDTKKFLSNAKFQLMEAYAAERSADPESSTLPEIDALIIRITRLTEGEVSLTQEQKRNILNEDTLNIYDRSVGNATSSLISAVKHYRTHSGLGLMESRHAVERLIRERK